MIYFIVQESDKFVKIGYTRDRESLYRRLSTLQAGNPHVMEVFGTMRGGLKAEGFLHKKFKDHRMHRKREWFHGAPIMNEIKRLMDEDRFLASRHSRPMNQTVTAYNSLMKDIDRARPFTTEKLKKEGRIKKGYLRDGFTKADIYQG